MEVSNLTEALVPHLDGYLRKDPVKNAYLIHDLWEERSNSDFYLTLKSSDVKGLLLVYKGHIEGPSAILRGEKEAVSKLIEELPQKVRADLVTCWTPPEATNEIKPYLTIKSKCSGKILSLEKIKGNESEQTFSTGLTERDSNSLAKLWSDWIKGSQDDLQEQIEENMASPKNTYFGIRKNDEGLISVAHTTRVPPGVAIVRALYTKPGYRNKGYGTSVITEAIEEELKSVGRICLNIRGDNPTASHLYEKLGFSQEWEFDWLTLN